MAEQLTSEAVYDYDLQETEGIAIPEPTIESDNNNNNKRKTVSNQMTFVPVKSIKSSKSKAINQIEKQLFQETENLPIHSEIDETDTCYHEARGIY